jgi:hypothetical protein
MGKPAGTASRRGFVANTAVVAVVLGVLPFLWEAHLVWRLLGPAVAGALLTRAAVLTWRAAVSTDPRHLTPTG